MAKTNQEEQRKTPILRFKGFTNDWEQRQLKEISESTVGGGTPRSSNKDFWNGNIPWIQSSDLMNDDIWNVTIKKHITSDAIKNSSAKVISTNSIAVVTRVAVGKLVYMPLEYATSQDFISFQNLNGNHSFLMYLVSKVMHKIKGSLQGTSIKGVSKGELLKKKIIYTLNIKEQKKIGTLLKSLDTILALYERKIKLLSQIKKYFLDNLFAKNEYPNLRFKGFTNAWEQRKLSDLANIIVGGTPSTKKNQYWDGNIPWMSSGEINKKRIYKTDKLITKLGLENSSAKFVPENSVLIALAGQGKTRGKVAINNIELTINQSLAGIIPTSEDYYGFIFYNLEKRYFELRSLSSGAGSRGGLNKKLIQNIKVQIPNLKEQILISKLSETLDKILTLYELKNKKIAQLTSGGSVYA